MRAIWKGAISFGLVNIPVALYPATRREEVHFKLLRDEDLSPIGYKRVAESDGKEVPWEHIVKGYEVHKGQFVVLKEEDFKQVDLESNQTVAIRDFVSLEEVNPAFFQKPYFMEPEKGGEKAYALLREVLSQTGKVGIAQVVLKTREHLAAVKSQGGALMLELMHFADELVDPGELKAVPEVELGKRELDMAKALVESMTEKWDPARYHDRYKEALEKLIEQKLQQPGAGPSRVAAARTPTKVIDLVAVLQKSLEQTGASGRKPAGKAAKESSEPEHAPKASHGKRAKKAGGRAA